MDIARRSLFAAGGIAATVVVISGCNRGGGGGGEITWLAGNDPNNVASAEALVEAFNASQDEYTFTVESRPTGTEGDNLIKTRLSTKDMPDAFNYNSGSLFQAISPLQNLMDLSDQPWVNRVLDAFKPAVTADGKIYGAPLRGSNAGGIMYHRPTYEKLGLEVPLTWDDFIANCEAAKASGIDGIIQSYGETWTSQFIVLADFHNVAAANPDFAEQYTAHEVGFSDDDVALRAFERTEQVTRSGFINEDYVSATYQQAVGYVATGAGAHYPIFTSAISEIMASTPDVVEDVGFFALPGDDAATNGLTIWLPDGLYVPAFAENPDAAKAFIHFATTAEGLEAMAEASPPIGPYLVNDVELPTEVPGAVKDLQKYFEEERTTPALEFSSPIKGPNLENILIQLGTGEIDAKTAAQNYDKDVEKQAQQLGLPGW